MSDKEFEIIGKEAIKYLKLSDEELNRMLLHHWYEVSSPENSIPTKGDAKVFLQEVIKRLAKKIVKNRATVSSAFGLAIGEAVNWAKNQGYDFAVYRVFISVMAVAIVKLVLEKVETTNNTRGAGKIEIGGNVDGNIVVAPAEEVSFTAYHPKEGRVESWHTLLVYVHALSALKKVRKDAKKFTEEIKAPKETASAAPTRLARGTEITIVPSCEGITFNPERVSLKWMEDFHRSEFRFKADRSLSADAAKGLISIYVGPLIIATLKFAMLFSEAEPQSVAEEEQQANMYRKDAIFISYSHKDTNIVEAFKLVHRATGHDVLIDIDNLRSGEEWNAELMRMIDRADIFQLFWSPNSSQSKYCAQEWEYALKQNKEGFIRPVFWQQPIPNPPEELSKYHFEYIELLGLTRRSR